MEKEKKKTLRGSEQQVLNDCVCSGQKEKTFFLSQNLWFFPLGKETEAQLGPA